MRVAIVHNAVPFNARADEQDVLAQVDAVRTALAELQAECEVIPVDLNLGYVVKRLREYQAQVVFNLVESLGGSDQLATAAAAVLEACGFPITGSPSTVLWLTNHKTLAKVRMRGAGLPTPFWHDLDSLVPETRIAAGSEFILKPVGEHASIGMDDSALVRPADAMQLRQMIQQHSESLGRPCFAEQFISGREFNLSLLAEPTDCQVLPIAEIDFAAYPADKPRIVDYQAKWDPESFEFQNTPRRFLSPHVEPTLTKQLTSLACRCWSLFQLGGYARVDFRVDETGQPWILEVNTNPCLSPDAGFAAALQQAEISFTVAVQRILDNAVAASRSSSSQRRSTQPAKPAVSASATGRARPAELQWRFEVTDRDAQLVRELVAETGFFNPEEIGVAEELVVERLAKGDNSGYHFVLAEIDGQLAGYASYGHIAGTRDSYDLYWIAVHPRHQGQGIGRLILDQAEQCIQQSGGRRVYIETSNREQYQSTRGFYLSCGYECDAILANFYGAGDDKVIYVKVL